VGLVRRLKIVVRRVFESVAALIIKGSLDDKIVQLLNGSLKPATINRISVSELPVSTSPSETDLRIIKCLVQSGARMEISEIAGLPLFSAYVSSKFALEGLSESMAYELQPFGIKVALIDSGSMNTNFRGELATKATKKR
jgi:NAD(P)-dependent dehydrogenase (short-subunit alcohol dehydrogenase family)